MSNQGTLGHILAINDDFGILAMYTDLLTGEGYRVTVERLPFADVAEVLAVAPDLIVVDMLVGSQDRGSAFIALLRSNPTTDRIPVIVSSAAPSLLAQIDDRLRAWSCTVFTKPFAIDDFLAVIAASLADQHTSIRSSADQQLL